MIQKFLLIILSLFLTSLVSAQTLKPIVRQGPTNPSSVKINKQFSVDHYNDKGQAAFISGELAPSRRTNDLKAQAQTYLQEVSDLMKVSDEDQFALMNEWVDDLGFTHLKYQQQHNNIPIYGSEVILHSKENVINSLNGVYTSTKGLAKQTTTPSIQPNEVVSIVKEEFRDSYKDFSDNTNWLSRKLNQWEKELVFFNDESGLRLSYHVKVYPRLGEWMTYFIDAENGSIIKEYSNICQLHAGKHIHADGHKCDAHEHHSHKVDNESNVNINTYEFGNGFYMIDGSRSMFNLGSSNLPNDPVGAIWTIDAGNSSPDNTQFTHVTSGNNSWNQRESVSAHSNAGKSFEYFAQVHNRVSIDGNGGTIISIVNIANENGSSMGNAFWDGAAIYYGNGDNAFFPLGRGLDVAGHELSHGVVQRTANLEYYGESGAMNESFADIFGAMIDRDDWQIGEDVVKPGVFPSGALRDMQDPHNGAPTGNFGGGWQPKHVNEMFTGPEDNNGVHINSGIPNHAYYLIAMDIGKDKAEKIFYRALNTYLTKSSQFTDLRIAVERATTDLYNGNEINAVQNAFGDVGIGSGGGGNYENDAETNPGQDFVLYTDLTNDNIYLADGAGMILSNPLSSTGILSKPSVTDDGEEIVFVGKDKNMYIINIDWQAGTAEQNVLEETAEWRNVIISKDGNRVAGLFDERSPRIWVFDFSIGGSLEFDLYNPTYTEGISTGDVLYADVMEFDLSGDVIMYDAANEIQSQTAGNYEYWDIGFLEVWNSTADTWALGNIEKAFPALPEGSSIGNPTFAKNSPYVIAFDFIDGQGNQVLGANLERGTVGLIYDNNVLGYPSFSTDDTKVVFDLNAQGSEELGVLTLNEDKITANPPSNTPWFFADVTPSQWGVWFSNGVRVLSDLENVEAEVSEVSLFPNPTSEILNIKINGLKEVKSYEIYDMMGRLLMIKDIAKNQSDIEVNVSRLAQGTYVLGVTTENKRYNSQFVINR